MTFDNDPRETVLVIEDDPGIAELERLQLERAGFVVVTAGTPEEALDWLHRLRVDLLLLDYRLSGDLDGLDVYLEWKVMGFDLPVILVTGFSNEAVAIRALRAGVRDLIAKSAEYLDYLPEAVERVLKQVQMERRLAESEARLTSIIDSANDAIIIAETGLQITLFNQAAEAMFRCPASEALGQSVSHFIPQEYPLEPELKSNNLQLAQELLPGLISSHNRGVRMDGTEFPLELSVSRTEVGGRSFYTLIVRDITERQRADTRKNEFLAMLAHELRNPLAALSSGLMLLAQTHDVGDHDWALEMSMRQARHLARLIDDLLDTSRITRGTIRLQKERVQPAEVIGRAVEAMRNLAEAKGHQLRVLMAPRLPELEADPTRMEQIVSNLLTNAIKFTPPGGQVEVLAQTEGNLLVITVRDTGDGIAPEFLPHVFELFVQADTSLARERGGLGMGLTLVKALIEQHGGTVEARSDGSGRGSEFIVRVPTLVGDETVGPVIESVEGQPPLDACLGSGPVRILMVEDNLEYARGLGRLLEAVGYEIRISRDGPTALDEAQRWIPDVFLLDLGLPGMDGYEVAQRIRKDALFTHAKLIVVSGYAGEEERRRSSGMGIDAHLAKPVALSDLVRTINNEHRASLASN